jgi:predicted acyltransferase
VAGGFSLLLLGALHQIIDVWGMSRWATAFVWIGANAITLYFLNNVANFQVFATRLVGGDIGAYFDRHVAPASGRLLAAAAGVTLAILLARFLYRRKIFLRV